MQKLIKKLLAKQGWLTFISSVVLLLLLLAPVTPSSPSNKSIPYVDKIAHIILFAGCTISILFDSNTRYKKVYRQIIIVTLIMIVGTIIGYCIELLQGKYLNRTYSIEDVVADFIGMIVGILFYYILLPYFREFFYRLLK